MALGETVIKPDDKRINYIGRFDFKKEGVARYSWPGTQIEFNFTGTKAGAVFSPSPGVGDRLLILVNGEKHKIISAMQPESYFVEKKKLKQELKDYDTAKKDAEMADIHVWKQRASMERMLVDGVMNQEEYDRLR